MKDGTWELEGLGIQDVDLRNWILIARKQRVSHGVRIA